MKNSPRQPAILIFPKVFHKKTEQNYEFVIMKTAYKKKKKKEKLKLRKIY